MSFYLNIVCKNIVCDVGLTFNLFKSLTSLNFRSAISVTRWRQQTNQCLKMLRRWTHSAKRKDLLVRNLLNGSRSNLEYWDLKNRNLESRTRIWDHIILYKQIRKKMFLFCLGWFPASAKDNLNVEESSKFLVQKIIENDKWSAHGARWYFILVAFTKKI